MKYFYKNYENYKNLKKIIHFFLNFSIHYFSYDVNIVFFKMSIDIVSFPLYTIFILVLIISANFLAQLFPCRLQQVFNESMFTKHLFGFFTMIFFVVLSAPMEDKSLKIVIPKAFTLYILFRLLTIVNKKIFY